MNAARIFKQVIFAMLFLLLAPTLIFAQKQTAFAQIDEHAQAAHDLVSQDIASLFAYLTAEADTDLEKVRSFYTWIIYHINYDQEMVMDLERKFSRPDVEAILKSKKAICQGYSQLFAALCEKAQIPCEIISGYAKKTSAEKPALSEQDHAWNAVLIDDQWQLLDLTWASGIARQPAAFPLNQPDDYFFTPPVKFLTTHLPADPLWQLLDCPLTPSQFQEAEDQTEALLATNTDCISFRDSINALQQLPLHERRLLTAVNAWKFNPTDKNAKELGQLYMDQFVRLSEVEERLQQTDSLGTLLEVQRELFFLADEAQKYTSLYDWQKENLAYIYLNFAVALSMDLMNLEDPDTTINTLRQMEQSLLKTEEILAQVPANFLTEQAQKRCSDYLGYVRENLEAYRR